MLLGLPACSFLCSGFSKGWSWGGKHQDGLAALVVSASAASMNVEAVLCLSEKFLKGWGKRKRGPGAYLYSLYWALVLSKPGAVLSASPEG